MWVTSADGTRLSVTEIGRGPAVLIVHGSRASSIDWQPVADRLSSRYRVLLLDRRNHGRSEPGRSPHSLDREVDDIHAVLTEIGTPAAVFGHSFGAVLALELARRRTTPIAALAVYEPPTPIGVYLALPAALLDYVTAVEQRRLPDAVRTLLAVFNPDLPRRAVDLLAADPEMQALTGSWLPEIEAMRDVDGDPEAYAGITARTLIVSGGQDGRHLGESVQDMGRSLSRTLPAAHLIELPGHGHFAHVSSPAALAEALGDFLDRGVDLPATR
ncbi:alpha/beta hydrolase [Nocardia sp. NPDC046763]|uniref:alpha/beta fold hydrolase n=1 Tax=Nocardia sp. NPDC046763 TaxID=3155256 RepID=UPI00340B6D6A